MSGTQRGARPAAAPVEEDPNAAVTCSSPPCFMHELDPSYLGYLSRGELSALLEGLLAAEWGGVVPDEARLRAELGRHLEPPGGSAAPVAPPHREPGRLAQAIREALPRIYDDALRRGLEEVLGALERGGGPDRDGAPNGS